MRGPVPSNSRPARAPREQRHPGRAPGNAASGCRTERRPSPGVQCSLSSSGPAGGLSLDTVLQFLRTLNVPPAALVELEKPVPPPAPKKTAQQQTKEQRSSQLRGKGDVTKQQLAKLSMRRDSLEKEYMEMGAKVEEKTRELAQLETELEKARGLIMQPTPPSTPPPSQGPHGDSSPRVSAVASSGVAVDAELLLLDNVGSGANRPREEGEEKGPKRLHVSATGDEALPCSKFFLLKTHYSHSQRDVESALGWSGDQRVAGGDVKGGVGEFYLIQGCGEKGTTSLTSVSGPCGTNVSNSLFRRNC